MTKKEALLSFFDLGIGVANKQETITLVIKNDEMQEPELITNPYCNFKYKRDYIEKAYNDDLELKTTNKIKIIDYYCN